MKINIRDFCAAAGKKVKFDRWLTQVRTVYKSKKLYKAMPGKQVEEQFDMITGFEALKARAQIKSTGRLRGKSNVERRSG
jgi:phage antirepressor YoqD-like protein